MSITVSIEFEGTSVCSTKYLDINYNACASIDREKLLIPGADHTMSAIVSS